MARPRLYEAGQLCIFEGCGREARVKDGKPYCAGHLTQLARKQSLRPLQVRIQGRDPETALKDAALKLSDAEEESDFHKAWRALKDAAIGYAQRSKRKWTSFRVTVRKLVL